MNRSPDHIFDEWLVLRAQNGEIAAMNELVRRWNRRLRAHALCLLRDDAAAADATQDAWHDIIRSIRKLADPAAYRVWMYRILSRKCADHIRRTQRERQRTGTPSKQAGGAPETPDPRPTPLHDAQQIEELGHLSRALTQLPADLRAIVSLRYRENFPLAAIAIVMDCPSGTVKSRLHEARRQLLALLEPTPGKD